MKSKGLFIIVIAVAQATLTCSLVKLAFDRSGAMTTHPAPWLSSTALVLSIPVLLGMTRGDLGYFGDPFVFVAAFMNGVVLAFAALGIVALVARLRRLTK